MYSNSDYKRLGDRIRQNNDNVSEGDYEMLQYLRTSYKYPLSIVFNSIRDLAYKVDPNSICTYRIKRIESIISKLVRFPEMQVNRAEDIAGCRCILSSEKDVYKLYERILRKQDKLPFEIKGKINDYIANTPPSGYKSIHINVVLKGENQRMEIQLRSIEHHNWATLVETTDLLYGLKLKERGAYSNNELFRLHSLLSKSSSQLSSSEIEDIANTIIKYDYIKKIGDVFVQNYIDVRRHWNSLKLQTKHFFLISTGSDGIPEIKGFDNFDDAESQYFKMFINNKSNKNIVLTHLQKTNFTKISIAYSNYFLTYNNTLIKILQYLSLAVQKSFKLNKILRFCKYYQAFLDIMSFWLDKQIIEMRTLGNDENIIKSKTKYKDWENNIVNGILSFAHTYREMQKCFKFNVLNIVVYMIMKVKHKKFMSTLKEILKNNIKNKK